MAERLPESGAGRDPLTGALGADCRRHAHRLVGSRGPTWCAPRLSAEWLREVERRMGYSAGRSGSRGGGAARWWATRLFEPDAGRRSAPAAAEAPGPPPAGPGPQAGPGRLQ
ncbi:hypothetical protein QJS66_07295 [Kocuria rhizophila]|nr:hypothetical protein QJS66_07295 [Kocuria rhizophila]